MTETTERDATGWNRFKAALPYLVTAFLFVAGAWALYHLLATVDIRTVMTQVRATPLPVLGLALLTTLCSYACLVGYDWSALRYIGKHLPPQVIVLGSFLGYAVGNTIGAGPITGGAVRYRIYSALGLSAYDIATIAAFGATAFGFGATILGFGALSWHPQALSHILQLPPATIRWGSSAIVLASVAILAVITVRRSEITLRGLTLRAPTPGIMASQFLFTAVDILFAATTLYLLLPPSDLPFPTFLAVFSAALMAGIVSHVPGGVGIFETVIIAALPASVPIEQAASGLLLYRLIYYLFPFSLALLVLAITEMRIATSRRTGRVFRLLGPLFRTVSAIVPLAIATMIFASGVILMISSLLPPTSDLADDLELILPLPFVEGGALLSSAIGAAMLVISHGLLRRVQGAWWLAVAALAGGMLATLANGLDFERAALLGAALLVLLPTKAEFFRTTRLTRNVLSLRWLLMVLTLAVSLLGVLFFAQKATPYAHDLWWQFASDQSAPRALRAALLGGIVLTLILLAFALRPGVLHHELASPEDLDRARTIIRTQPDPQANIALTGDKSLLFSDSGRSFLMYRIRNRSWIALREPVGDPAEFAQLAWAFHDLAYAANARPIFYSVSAAQVPLWIDMGLALIKMGEEAVVPLTTFSLDGPERKRLRTTWNRAQRDGLTLEVLTPPFAPGFVDALRPISDAWLLSKSGGEKAFSVGTFDPAVLEQAPIAVVRAQDRIVAFASLWVTGQKTAAAIDLMRHVDDAPNNLMEFLFTGLLLHFAADGYAEFSLGNAPLSGLEARRGARLTTHLGAFVYTHGRHFYNFEGLRGFKEKFDPEWRPVYIAVPPRANILAVAGDIVSLIGGGLRKSAAPPRAT